MPTSEEVLDVAGLDRLHRIGGGEFVLEMIDLFLENAPQRLAAARAAVEAGDQKSLYRAAHSLKSTAANLGAQRLQGVAERLESLAAAGGTGSLGSVVSELEESYEQARGRLDAERTRRRPHEDQPRGQP